MSDPIIGATPVFSTLNLPPRPEPPRHCDLKSTIRILSTAMDHDDGTVGLLHLVVVEEDPVLRAIGFVGLKRIAGELVEDLPGVLGWFYGGEYSSIRWLAATTLGLLGPAARPAIRLLGVKMLSDCHWAVRAACAEAIGRIGPDRRGRRSLVTTVLFDRSRRVRDAADVALNGDWCLPARRPLAGR